MKPVSPAWMTKVLLGVRRHCAPFSKYQASGPGCVWAGVPITVEASTLSIYRAKYFLDGGIGSGPITATRSPLEGLQPAGAILNSQAFPNDITTVSVDVFLA